jgi:hypothetical protein
MEADREFKEVRVAAAVPAGCCGALLKGSRSVQVLEQSIEPSLFKDSVVIAGGGTLPYSLPISRAF